MKECHKINLYDYEKFSAINITLNNYKDYKMIDPNKAWKKNNIEYLKSATGCKMSHLEVLKKYKNIKKEYLMILEDDIVFEDNTLIYLNLSLISLKNINWDILFLATNLKNQEDATLKKNSLLKISKGLTTTAQIFNVKNIDKIINLIENSDVETDNTYNELENKYCVYPMCVFQRDSYSDINKKNMDYGKFHQKYIY
jgi:GR25 family glycosyltransferase involved in LPS biosynthesis